jgi:lipopolysaccharide cholinephosphotransferase
MFNTEDEILRRLQEKNLEMAVMFYHWCQRNHLTCYLCGGGCIGAIRHGGFIPWDDDLDFFMPRKDYEKFLKIWDTQEESKIYKLEYPKEGFCNAHTFANIRDSRTTQVKKEQVDMDLCHGVALDILPIEGYAPGNLARKWQVIEGKIFQLFYSDQRTPRRVYALPGNDSAGAGSDAEDAVPDLEAGRELYYKI